MAMRVLNKRILEDILNMRDVISEVRNVYSLKANNQTVVWPLVDYIFENPSGRMDIRSGYIKQQQIHGMKMLNNFPGNTKQELPPFNGVLMIYDSNNGLPLGLMDASHITCLRTGAAGALGASLLAKENASNVLIVGAGKQAIFQIAALIYTMPTITKIIVVDPLSYDNSINFVKELPKKLNDDFALNNNSNIIFQAQPQLKEAVMDSDVIITITPSTEPLIMKEWVKEGTHFSCVGSDMPGKQEIDEKIFLDAKIFCDDIKQCLRVGEVEKAIKNNIISENDISGELGMLLLDTSLGRDDEKQITIFDATGLAMLDLVVGNLALKIAQEKKIGLSIDI